MLIKINYHYLPSYKTHKNPLFSVYTLRKKDFTDISACITGYAKNYVQLCPNNSFSALIQLSSEESPPACESS